MSMEVLQITVPTELAEEIRARVRSGEYASESDVVIDLFYGHALPDATPEELAEQLRLGLEALEEMEQHPESAGTHEQVWAEFDAYRASRGVAAA